MTPVAQSNFEKFTGDCWSACIASILDLPLSKVPNFCHKDLGPLWLKRTIDWCASSNVGVIHIQNAAEAMKAQPHLMTRCFCIVSGRSPRASEGEEDFLHAVVGACHMEENDEGYFTRIELRHDPHPSGQFIVGDPTELTFLIPFGERS